MRRPRIEEVEDPRLREALERVVAGQEIPPALPAYDRLLFDEAGGLWVRVVDEALRDLHPTLSAGRAELGPSQRRWDVLRPGWAVAASWRVTSALDLRMVVGETGYGFLTLPSGEVTLAQVDFR